MCRERCDDWLVEREDEMNVRKDEISMREDEGGVRKDLMSNLRERAVRKKVQKEQLAKISSTRYWEFSWAYITSLSGLTASSL